MAEAEIGIDESLLERFVEGSVGQLHQVATCLDALAVLSFQEKGLDVVELDRIVVGDWHPCVGHGWR